MLLLDTLKGIAHSQKDGLSHIEYGTPREALDSIDAHAPHATILSGIRRCGKSTLLRQIMRKINRFCYFNFEDPRAANFEVGDFERLDAALESEYGKSEVYFFDEIQNVEKWELFVRKKLDEKKRFFITGSNASLLSKELGTRLTGRHLNVEVFPFSYKEFLAFNSKKPGIDSFREYFKQGGFPEYVKYKNNAILHELFNDILARDVLVRQKLRSVKTIKEMALYLLSNVGKEFSYNGLKNTFELGSTNSAINFVSYLEDTYLLFTVPKFDYSLKKQRVNPKKVYSIDNGMSTANSSSFSEDNGRMLENQVFLELKRSGKEVYYFKQKRECDFIVKDRGKVAAAIQVCYDLNEDNKSREIEGLTEAMEALHLQEGLLLTSNNDDKIDNQGNKSIKVKPVWKWLMKNVAHTKQLNRK